MRRARSPATRAARAAHRAAGATACGSIASIATYWFRMLGCSIHPSSDDGAYAASPAWRAARQDDACAHRQRAARLHVLDGSFYRCVARRWFAGNGRARAKARRRDGQEAGQRRVAKARSDRSTEKMALAVHARRWAKAMNRHQTGSVRAFAAFCHSSVRPLVNPTSYRREDGLVRHRACPFIRTASEPPAMAAPSA